LGSDTRGAKEAVVGEKRVWIGVDAGKGFHWAVVLDAEGEVLLSRRVENDEADLSALVEEALSHGLEPTWATDQPGGSAALLLAVLWERGQRVLYVPGIAVDRARDMHKSMREQKITGRGASGKVAVMGYLRGMERSGRRLYRIPRAAPCR